jgi:hypothetical protein
VKEHGHEKAIFVAAECAIDLAFKGDERRALVFKAVVEWIREWHRGAAASDNSSFGPISMLTCVHAVCASLRPVWGPATSVVCNSVSPGFRAWSSGQQIR